MFLSNGVKFLKRTTYLKCLKDCYGCRTVATEKNNFVSVTIDPEFDGSVAVVKMQKKPVNSLCSNHISELVKTIDELENNEKMRAMIITSAFPGIFCAGLDFKCMLGATHDDIYTFVRHVQGLMLKTYGSRLITIAAINGHCVAGGNVIAFAADYRVMTEGQYRIGLNETKLGLFVPFYLSQMMENLVGTRATVRAVQLATMFTSAEALKIGLVEELAPMDKVLTEAKKEMKHWLEIPDLEKVVDFSPGIVDSARTLMKMEIRKKELQKLIDRRKEDAKTIASIISRPHHQEQLRIYVNNMKN